jgi:hypothetical protein
VLCREHGQQLMQLAAENDEKTSSSSSSLKGFELFGVIKETGVVRNTK